MKTIQGISIIKKNNLFFYFNMEVPDQNEILMNKN